MDLARRIELICSDGDGGMLRGTASDLLLVLSKRKPLDAMNVEGDAWRIAETIAAIDMD